MRWNCPHCETIVSLGIDIDQVKQAYVRCGACKGVAFIQKRQVSSLDSSQEFPKSPDEITRDVEISLPFHVQPPAAQPPITPPPFDKNRLKRILTEKTPQTSASVDTAFHGGGFESTGFESAGTDSFLSQPEGSPVIGAPPSSASPQEIHFDKTEDMIFQMGGIAPGTQDRDEIREYDDGIPDRMTWSRSPDELSSLKTPSFLLDRSFDETEAFSVQEEIPVRARARKNTVSERKLSIAVRAATAIALISGAYLFVEGKKLLSPSFSVTQPSAEIASSPVGVLSDPQTHLKKIDRAPAAVLGVKSSSPLKALSKFVSPKPRLSRNPSR